MEILDLTETFEALEALRAGIWDNPSLMKFGPLMPSKKENSTELKRRWLANALGFKIGDRDPQLNRNHAGRFMVLETPDDVIEPTNNGANGPWCIVGDDLDALIRKAFTVFADIYTNVHKAEQLPGTVPY